MALAVADRVQETTTTTGTGTLTLAGAVTGYQTFASIGDGNTTYYTIVSGADWEVGIGTYTASGTTLSRDIVLTSSAGPSTKINVASGAFVFCDYPAGAAVYDPLVGAVTIPASPSQTYQLSGAIAIGEAAGNVGQSQNAIAIGLNAGQGFSNSVTYVSGDGNPTLTVSTTSALSPGDSLQGYENDDGGLCIITSIVNGTQLELDFPPIVTPSGSLLFTSGQSTNSIAIGASAALQNQGSNGIAIGRLAAAGFQQVNAIAVGNAAGQTSQGSGAVAIGSSAGSGIQGNDAVSIGSQAGQNTQSTNAIAIGSAAGNEAQGGSAVAIGINAGQTTQSASAVAIGSNAGNDVQGTSAVAVGEYAGSLSQSQDAVAVGSNAGYTAQGQGAVAVGVSAGNSSQGTGSVAIGNHTAQNSQLDGSIAIGDNTAFSNQGQRSIAIGYYAADTTQGADAVAIGNNAGRAAQQRRGVSVGVSAGTGYVTSKTYVSGDGNPSIVLNNTTNLYTNMILQGYMDAGNNPCKIMSVVNSTTIDLVSAPVGTLTGTLTFTAGQGIGSVAVGGAAGSDVQGPYAVAVGDNAGAIRQGDYSVAVGTYAGQTDQTWGAVAVGNGAGGVAQGTQAVAVGSGAGANTQSQYGIAIGSDAGAVLQSSGGIGIGAFAAGGVKAFVNYVSGGTGTGQVSMVVEDTAFIQRGATITGTGFVSDQKVITIVDATTVICDAADSTPSGELIFSSFQGQNAIAIGVSTGQYGQANYSIAIGAGAGTTDQKGLAVGNGAADRFQGSLAVAIGDYSGANGQENGAVAIGGNAGTGAITGVTYVSGDGNPTLVVNDTTELIVGMKLQGYRNAGFTSCYIESIVDATTITLDSVPTINPAGSLEFTSGQRVGAVAIGQTAGSSNQGSAAVSVGISAGEGRQGASAVAVGPYAGNSNQGGSAIAIGQNAAYITQGGNSIAVGNQAGFTNQGIKSIAVGYGAGSKYQGGSAIAIGDTAAGSPQYGKTYVSGGTGTGPVTMTLDSTSGLLPGMFILGTGFDGSQYVISVDSATDITCDAAISTPSGGLDFIAYQSGGAVAIGAGAGYAMQNSGGIAIGSNAAEQNQGISSIAIGGLAGRFRQKDSSVAVGYYAGSQDQNASAVAVGPSAGQTTQGSSAVAIGDVAGNAKQGAYSVAIGSGAGNDTQGTQAVAIGQYAGQVLQKSNTVAIGYNAGANGQSIYSVAIGNSAGQGDAFVVTYVSGDGNPTVVVSSTVSLAVGMTLQGYTGDGPCTISAIVDSTTLELNQAPSPALSGDLLFTSGQQVDAVAIGRSAGANIQGTNAVAIGTLAGSSLQGDYSVAIGPRAGDANQPANSIIINAQSAGLNGTNAGLYIDPVRNDTGSTTNAVYYNTTTKEVTYGPAGGGGGVTSFNTRTGAVTLLSSDVTTALTYTPPNQTNPVLYNSVQFYGSGVTGYTPFANTMANWVVDVNDYSLFYLQNKNNGTSASADYVVYNDASDVDSYFIDMGINSSNYSSATYPIFTPNSSYLFSGGGTGAITSDMFIGTSTPGSDVVLFAGGVATTDEVMRIKSNHNVIIGTDPDTGETFQVSGSTHIKGATEFGSTVLLAANPTTALQAATKQYVDNVASSGIHIHQAVYAETSAALSAVYVQGGTTFNITDITGGNTVVTSVAHGLVVNDQIWLTTTAGNGLSINTPYFVYATPTTTSLQLSASYGGALLTGLTNATGLSYATRANSGVGAYLESSANATFTIGSYTLTVGDRILVYQQSTAYWDGVYTITSLGSGSSKWKLTRATDQDQYAPQDTTGLGEGDYFLVTTNSESYVLTTTGAIIIGYTGLTYTLFSSAPVYTGGTNINIAGGVISVSGTIAATLGGTGTSTVTTGDLLYGSATNTWSKLPAGAAYKSLVMNAGGTNVEWNAVALDQATAVAGQLGISNGGTGASSAAAALTALGAYPDTNPAGYTTNTGTVTSVALTNGTGISISGSPITSSGTITVTNTAPDQVVSLTNGTGISVTGTYPNFTITNTSTGGSGTVTSVAALTLGTTGTDLSSTVANSTTTPVITLNVPTASASNRGALSNTDWSTFNGKQDALVSGTNIKTINGSSVLGSGNLTVSASAGGSNTQVQYNSTGALAGDANFTYDGTTLTAPTVKAATGGFTFPDATTQTTTAYPSTTANKVLASPDGSTGTPTYRALVSNDIPDLLLTKLPEAWTKMSVNAATTANITLSGTQTVDGVALVAGNRCLVKSQTAAQDNGIYDVSAGAWTRSADANSITKIAGAAVNVDAGTVNGGKNFDNDLKTTDTLGTTAMNWYSLIDTNGGTFGGTVTLRAGTATAGTAPLYMTSGTNLTAAAAGAVEYDGKLQYFTPAATSRALTPSTYFYRKNTATTLSSATGNQSIFALTSGVTVQANTIYEIECEFNLTTSGTTSHTESFGFTLATATVTNMGVAVNRLSGNTTSSALGAYLASVTPVVVTGALTTAQNCNYRVKGTIAFGTGGSFNPVVAFSAAPGGTSTILLGSWMKVTPIGTTGANVSIGTWA